MANATNIRGPFPSQPITSGEQSYFVDERLGATQIRRNVMLILQSGKITVAGCTCTSKASLSLPCSHINSVLNYIGITTSVSYTPRQISARARKSTLAAKPNPPPISATITNPKPTRSQKPEVIINNNGIVLPDFITEVSQVKFVIKAVQDEIEEIQNSPNVKQVLITNGQLIGSLGESFRYKFDMSDDFRSPPDIPIELHIGSEDLIIKGSILRSEPDSFIELALDQFHGKTIPQAKLISRLDFIWKAAEKKLSSLGEVQNLEILKFALNPRPEKFYEVSVDEDWGKYPPNNEQRTALETSLCQKVSFIYGPPGTGKSQTIGWLVKELIRRGEKVIITSHTNIAVDNALQKVCETKEGKYLRDSGDIIRLGEPNNSLDDLRLSRIIERKSAGLKQKLDALKLEANKVEENKNSCEEEIAILKKYQSTLSDREKITGFIESISKKISENEKVVKQTGKSLKELKSLISSSNIFDFLLRPIRRAQANQVESKYSQYYNFIEKLKSQKQKALIDLASAEELLRKNNIPFKLSEFESELENFENQRLELASRLERIKENINSIQNQLDEMAKNIISEAKIIGLTLSKLCIDPSMSKLKYENLVIDELSTAPFPLVLVALIAPTKRAIFFGDPKQLPPISLSKTEYSQKYLQRDTYEIIDLHKNIRCELTEQWRMPVSIVEFVNLALYEGKLRTHPEFEKKRNEEILEGEKSPFKNYPFKDHQVIFIDTSSIGPWCGYDANHSRYNLYSSHIIAELIAQEVEEKPDWSSSKEDEKKKIGVICPYRAQKQLLKKLAHSRLEMEGKSELVENYIDFHTVDSFQGEQRDVVILDLTAGQPSSPGIRLSEKVETEIAGKRAVSKVRRLLNVAITRTKYQLVIVGNKNYFEREFKNDKNEYVLDIIQRASGGKGKYHVSIDGEDLLRGQKKSISGYSLFLSESDFYTHVKRDFDSATSSVVIVSPFITQNRVQDLLPQITSMLKRRVKVWIVTRPIEDADFGVGALKTLEQLGCIVKQRKRTHEKIVIIDNKVAYYGSLNVLSHKDTKEVMHRIQGEQITQLIQQFMDVIGYASKTNIQKIQRPINARLTRDECEGKLKHIRWTIATQRHIPFYAVLYNQTIDELLNNLPQTEEALYELLDECGEKQMKHLGPFLEEILSILQRYKG